MMNKTLSVLLTSILAVALLANANIGNVFATGNLDDEEEEEKLQTLENKISDIEDSMDEFYVELEQGVNDIKATCPITTTEQEEQQPEEQAPENNVTQPIGCNPVEEEQPEEQPTPTTAIPPVEAIEEPQGCNPIPEEEEQSPLEPIYCPINGQLLGFKNTTSGELLPPSANNTGFLPPTLEEPQVEDEQPTIAPEVPTNNATEQQQQCNNQTQQEEEQPQLEDEQPVEFDNGCGCFVIAGNEE